MFKPELWSALAFKRYQTEVLSPMPWEPAPLNGESFVEWCARVAANDYTNQVLSAAADLDK